MNTGSQLGNLIGARYDVDNIYGIENKHPSLLFFEIIVNSPKSMNFYSRSATTM